jgi:hypothetical protein
MDSELREILEALLRLPPERISQVCELLLSLQVEEEAPAGFRAEAAAFERIRSWKTSRANAAWSFRMLSSSQPVAWSSQGWR